MKVSRLTGLNCVRAPLVEAASRAEANFQSAGNVMLACTGIRRTKYPAGYSKSSFHSITISSRLISRAPTCGLVGER